MKDLRVMHTHTLCFFFHTLNEIEIWQCYRTATVHLALRLRPVFENFQKVKAEIWECEAGESNHRTTALCASSLFTAALWTLEWRTQLISTLPPVRDVWGRQLKPACLHTPLIAALHINCTTTHSFTDESLNVLAALPWRRVIMICTENIHRVS